MSMKIPQTTTAEQLLAASKDLDPCELVRGELIMMTPAGEEHSQVEGNIYAALRVFVQSGKLGRVYMGDAGFLLEQNPDTVRAPDVAFVCSLRIAAKPHKGFFPGPPDLAVEIRSPDDRPKEVASKIQDYLRLGVQVVWDVDSDRRTISVYRGGAEPQAYGEKDTLTEPALLPGFEMPVVAAFRW